MAIASLGVKAEEFGNSLRKVHKSIEENRAKDMVKPFLSIIVPAYKTENTLVRCLDSIFSQIEGTTLEDMVEVCAVNDCSPDNVGKILDEYRSKCPTLKVIHHKKNKGEAGAHNTGMEATVGEYFLRLDSDDVLKYGSVEKIVYICKKFTPDIILHGFTSLTPEGKYISQVGFSYEGMIDISSGCSPDVRSAFKLVAFGLMTPNVVYRRAAALDVRQDAKYKISGDRYFGWRCFCKSSRFYVTNEPFVDFYVYPSSMSRVLSDEAVAGLLELNIKFWSEAQEHPLFKMGRRQAFFRLFFGQVGWDYEIVFLAESEKRKHAALYFAALRNFLKGGASWRVIGIWHLYIWLACVLKSWRMMGAYHYVFYKFIWRTEGKLKRTAKRLLTYTKLGNAI